MDLLFNKFEEVVARRRQVNNGSACKDNCMSADIVTLQVLHDVFAQQASNKLKENNSQCDDRTQIEQWKIPGRHSKRMGPCAFPHVEHHWCTIRHQCHRRYES